MGGVTVKIIWNHLDIQPCDGWNPSDHPEFREFLDHVAEILAHEYVQRMRETADPKDIEAWENGGQR